MNQTETSDKRYNAIKSACKICIEGAFYPPATDEEITELAAIAYELKPDEDAAIIIEDFLNRPEFKTRVENARGRYFRPKSAIESRSSYYLSKFIWFLRRKPNR